MAVVSGGGGHGGTGRGADQVNGMKRRRQSSCREIQGSREVILNALKCKEEDWVKKRGGGGREGRGKVCVCGGGNLVKQPPCCRAD